MRFADLKYLAAYVMPISCLAGLAAGGIWSFTTVCIGFVIVPLVELFAKPDASDHDPRVEPSRSDHPFFDGLLYFNVPLVYAALLLFLYRVVHTDLAVWEVLGLWMSVGTVMSSNGINVAHELGHRTNAFDRTLSKALLLPSLYLQFHVEHNRGHHMRVCTPDDPATARFGEPIYVFWVRAIVCGFFSAWNIESTRVKKLGHGAFHWRNQMLRFVVLQIAYLCAVHAVFGVRGLLLAIGLAAYSVILLESIDYIEHYGLVRREISPGKYERTMPKHSWNSDQVLGRIFLYELTRHSDHHLAASREYQILRHHDAAPELPFGYPVSMMMALFPPLWFRVIHPRIPADVSGQPRN